MSDDPKDWDDEIEWVDDDEEIEFEADGVELRCLMWCEPDSKWHIELVACRGCGSNEWNKVVMDEEGLPAHCDKCPDSPQEH